MPKELPYFKFEPSEWLEGKIQICSDKTIACFTNLMAAYWSKSGCISYAFALHKYCRKDKDVLQDLIDNQIIQLDNDDIRIKFLDDQLKDVHELSQKRSQSAKKRWSNANALHLHSKSNAIRKEKIREDKNNILVDNRPINKNPFKTWSYDDFKKSVKSANELIKTDDDTLIEFDEYWTEETPQGKMKFQIEKTWDTSRRLKRWLKNKKQSWNR